jgi:hypothetical protein
MRICPNECKIAKALIDLLGRSERLVNVLPSKDMAAFWFIQHLPHEKQAM